MWKNNGGELRFAMKKVRKATSGATQGSSPCVTQGAPNTKGEQKARFFGKKIPMSSKFFCKFRDEIVPVYNKLLKMKAVSSVLVVATVAAMVVLLMAEVQATKAEECDINVLLGACERSLQKGGPPSEDCCKIIEEQQSCLCGYLQYNDWPGLYKTCGYCHVTMPQC